jgi:hypothetical protein
MSSINFQLMQLIMTAVDLSNKIEADIKKTGYVSDETILALNKFKSIHNKLSKSLDLMNLNIDNKGSGGGLQ